MPTSRDDDDPNRDPDGDAEEALDPDLVPTVVERAIRPDDDPLDRARNALRTARLARGLDPDLPDEPDAPDLPEESADPWSRAEQALARAAAARAEAAQGRRAMEREHRAREELHRLKGGAPPADDAPSGAEPPEGPPKPRKRRL